MSGITITTCRGPEVAPHLEAVARLRIAVFREFPYLYDGDADYERGYLATYARSPESLFVLARDGDTIVGASTGVPLADEVEAFRAPFRAAGIDPARVFYFGESVLLPGYRGQGLGHRFFDERERYAAALVRFDWTAFCAVVRAPDDPRRPPAYRPLDAFWTQRGYARHAGLVATLDWRETGAAEPVEHRLAFWLRPLEGR